MTTPQPQPFDVAAMLKRFYRPEWERDGWCDAEGRCWFGSPFSGPDGEWVLQKPSERLSHQTLCLPHWAEEMQP